MAAFTRDYTPADFEAVKAIHESTQLDYNMPDLNTPLFLVKKVLEVNGVVRVVLGMRIEAECYLWLDQSDWADPEEKLVAIAILDREGMAEAWLKGVDDAVLYLPPGMERFGKRLEALGFEKPRDGWTAYSKKTRTI